MMFNWLSLSPGSWARYALCGSYMYNVLYIIQTIANEWSAELSAKVNQVLGVPVHRLVQATDSVSVCFSKGLGALVGSVIVGTKSFIDKARILRKTLGGGMRLVGILCAAALVALQENVKQAIVEDVKQTKILAYITALKKLCNHPKADL
ncbi:unnamed protein product [Lactuca saligna]|uniref:Aromatic amino acid beta-eliminating lyase/threonine aldolase domain-containing protein n=1 Tax=Lactuca saligna TaxID=75948 RepID=A0AA36E0X6_LACSI|nr:unnamed protein product [Lactuca saligna]